MISFIFYNLSVVFCLFRNTYGHYCNHIPPKDSEVVTGVHLDSSHIIKKRSLFQPLRISLEYDESVYRLSQEKYDLIHEHILPEAINYWKTTLSIRKTTNIIRLNRKCRNNEVFLLKNDTQPYCKDACEEVTMCGEVKVPEQHLNECRLCNSYGQDCRIEGAGRGEGIANTDFVFYISAHETVRCRKGFTVAYAAHCQQEASLDRPIAGHANLCPTSITLKDQEINTLLSTVKHEILHALGFSVSLYAFYRDDDGHPLTERIENGKPALNEQLQARQWSDRVIKKIVRKDWKIRNGNFTKEINMMVTPRVVKEVQRHFNCVEIEGAELEDQGQEGTALTHWEKRVFENEAMTGTHTQNPIYSRITLALMEDTGWYKADYSKAQLLTWGKNLGCTFAMQSCKSWMDSQKTKGLGIHPFCNKVKRDPLETECTDHRTSVALCNLIEYENSLPSHYQNFDAIPHIENESLANYGGSVALADYCPYIQEFTWKSKEVVIRGSHCHFSENNPKAEQNFALESYSPESLCFDHANQWIEKTCTQIRKWQHWGSGCYEYFCSEGRLHIQVSNYTYTCFHKNQVIHIEIFEHGWLHQGAIMCPSCQEICHKLAMNCTAEEYNPVDTQYHKDYLECSSTMLENSFLYIFMLILCFFR